MPSLGFLRPYRSRDEAWEASGRFAPSSGGQSLRITVGASIFLIAIGAILRFAVQDSINDVDLSTVGLILMIVGAIGLVVGLWMTRRYTSASRPVVRDEYDRRL